MSVEDMLSVIVNLLKVKHLFKKLTFVHVGLIEQLQYLIYDSEVYFCVRNLFNPQLIF